MSALMFASINNRKGTVEMLINHKANINLRGRNGRTALHCAAQVGHQNICKILMQARADPAIKDTAAKSAIQMAMHKGHTVLADLIAHTKPELWQVPDVVHLLG